MSESVEMYLLTIYRLNLEGERAGIARLASRLGVSAASGTQMIKKLTERGLVRKNGNGLSLSLEGERLALGVIRKHRLAERLLTDCFKLPWDVAHEQSCRLEHILTDEVADAMETFLGNPATCPHGHPIPTRDGRVVLPDATPLADCHEGDRVVVDRVFEESMEVLRFLDEVRLHPGREIQVEQVGPRHLRVRLDGQPLALSREVADQVLVRKPD
ncbi:MAG: metal-dependent transcriptional regulator [Candidatus Eremiobacterota bacterium]